MSRKWCALFLMTLSRSRTSCPLYFLNLPVRSSSRSCGSNARHQSAGGSPPEPEAASFGSTAALYEPGAPRRPERAWPGIPLLRPEGSAVAVLTERNFSLLLITAIPLLSISTTTAAVALSTSSRSEASRRKWRRFSADQNKGWASTSSAESRASGSCAIIASTMCLARGSVSWRRSYWPPMMFDSRAKRAPNGWWPRVSM
mmetsp:Transcript_20056/g.76798  ORF Transcript_20056/g.76798 Transcript_20056/m.76798 type:complete len:201 (+) Transcript_20056:185-787(+)